MISIGLAKIEEFRFRVVQMEREVLKEKTRSRALADELEVPMNVHRFDVIYSTCRKYSFSIFFFLLRVYFCMYAYMYINICICKHTKYVHTPLYIHTYIKGGVYWRAPIRRGTRRSCKCSSCRSSWSNSPTKSLRLTYSFRWTSTVFYYLLICMKKSNLFIMRMFQHQVYMCMCGV